MPTHRIQSLIEFYSGSLKPLIKFENEPLLESCEEILEFSCFAVWNFCQTWNLTVTIAMMLLRSVACIFCWLACTPHTMLSETWGIVRLDWRHTTPHQPLPLCHTIPPTSRHTTPPHATPRPTPCWDVRYSETVVVGHSTIDCGSETLARLDGTNQTGTTAAHTTQTWSDLPPLYACLFVCHGDNYTS